MRFITFILACLFATAAYAQNVWIVAPSNGTSVSPGSHITVDVELPNFLSSSQEVAVVIGLQSCVNRPCPSPSDSIGTVLYNGPYRPKVPNPNPQHLQAFQNFTVQIPSSSTAGTALLSVTHIALIGASLQPWMEFQNVTLNIK